MGKGSGTGQGAGRYTICPTPGAAWETAKEWGNKILSAICCCLCTGPILTLIGIIFVISAIKDTRGNNIKKFNTGVATWATARTSWSARTFQYAGKSNVTVAFNPSTADPVRVPTETKVTPYEPLLFVSAASNPPIGFPNKGVNGTGYSITLSSAFNIIGSNSAPLTPDTAVSVFKKVQTSGGTSGTSTSGANAPPTPPTPPTPPKFKQQYVKTYCFVVNNGDNGYSGFRGCFANSASSQYAGGAWETADCGGTGTTELSPAESDVVAINSACLDFSGLVVQLRSSDDPMIQGFKNGACGSNPKFGCSFGLSRAAKLTIAFILLGVGICWTCCVYGGLYAVVLHFHNKK